MQDDQHEHSWERDTPADLKVAQVLSVGFLLTGLLAQMTTNPLPNGAPLGGYEILGLVATAIVWVVYGAHWLLRR